MCWVWATARAVGGLGWPVRRCKVSVSNHTIYMERIWTLMGCSAYERYEGDERDLTDPSNATGTADDNTWESIAAYQPYNMPHTRMRTYHRKGNLPNKGEKRQRRSDRYYCSMGCYVNLSNAGLDDGAIWTEDSSVLMQVLAESMRTHERRISTVRYLVVRIEVRRQEYIDNR